MIATFARFGRFLRPYRGRLALGAFLAIVTIVLGLAQPWPLKIVVDDVLGAHGRAGGTVPALIPQAASPRVLLAVAVGSLLALAVVGAAADYWATWLMESAGQRVGNDLRQALFAHLQRLSLTYHGTHTVGDLAARVTADVDRVQDLIVQSLSVLLPNALLVAGMAGVMIAVDPVFSAMALAVAPLLGFTIHRATRRMKMASRRARRFGGTVAAAATERLGAIQVVQAYSLEDRSLEEFRELNRASLDAGLEAARLQAKSSPLVDVAAAVSTAVVLWFGADRVLAGRLQLGVLLVFLAYLGAMYKPIKTLSKLGYVISLGAACAERIGTILDEQPDVVDRPHARPLVRPRGEITFEQVSFSYGREPVLHDVDLTIEAGELVALVGPTGAGKSTLVALLPRFFDPDEGSVRIDGVDVRDYRVHSLRDHIALVLQETALFSGTLRDNIACGRPQASDDAVREAARLALVDEFAGRLPDGLDTVVGERGANLSGGQRQRIAIARAIVRDAPILLLDEPTSALDAESETLVIEALHNLMKGRTTLVIAHRLSTVRRADRIVTLEAGTVVEQGTHEELVAANGLYARLSRLQRQGSAHRGNPVRPRLALAHSAPPSTAGAVRRWWRAQ